MDSRNGVNEPRDFLGEAARLALQLDPLAWEFDLSDRSNQAAFQPGRNGERGLTASAKPAPSTENWMDQQSNPQFIPGSYQGPSQMYSAPTWDASVLKTMQPRFDQVMGGSVPVGLERDAIRSRPTPEPLFLDDSQIDQLQNVFRTTQNNRFNHQGPWQLPQSLRPWNEAPDIKTEATDSHDETKLETDPVRAELEQLRKERDLLENHTKILEEALMNMSKESQATEIPDFIPSRGWTSFNPKASVIIEALFDPPQRISAEDAAHIPLREYAMLWRSYLKVVQDCLKDCRPTPAADPSPAEEKLKALLAERHGFLSWVAANNPSICHCLLTMDMGSDPPQKIREGLTPEKTREIMIKMALTEEQAVFLLDSRNSFLHSMGYHSAALRKLQQQLSSLDPTPKESVRNCHFLNWLHVARSLQETVEEMHICGITFHCKLYKMRRGITPYQAAVLMIESFPYLPDVIALISELAATRAAPSADDLFKLGTERYLADPDAAELKFVREPHPPANDRVGKITEKLHQWESRLS